MQAVKASPRLALDNMVFTSDFSPASERAFAYALALAKWYDSKVIVVHAVPPEPHYSVPLEPIPINLDPAWREARDRMAEFERAHCFGDIRHETVIEQGTPWDVVARTLRKQRTDLLVIGTHGRVGLKRLVLGSEAEIIFRQAPCPVLTVGPHSRLPEGEVWKPGNIIYATDFSPTSLHALPFALSLAEESQANLIVVHFTALVPIDLQDGLSESLVEQLRDLLPADAENWCRPSFEVRFEFPAEGILRLAEERSADLIVMGVRRRGMPSAASHLPWATAGEVVSKAMCPVLTVRG